MKVLYECPLVQGIRISFRNQVIDFIEFVKKGSKKERSSVVEINYRIL